MYYKSPTYNLDTGEWSHTEFETRKEMVVYVDSQVKYPGKYNLKYTNGYWNEQGIIFQTTKSYPQFLKGSLDFRRHWDFEKEKCNKDGFVIYKKPSEGVEFAVPGLMYWYLNYCPIEDKVKARIDLPEIYDGDYHYFLYILRCILRRKFGVILKKRQSGYTLKNMAIMLNIIWFGEAATAKIFARDESKVKDSWKLMVNYKDHINNHCGWTRGLDPAQPLNWQLRRKRKNGSYTGNMSIAKGFNTKINPTNGIGGSAALVFGEESGENPTLDITHEFLTSNVALGGLVTGLVIYSGAVGKLENAEPLKHFIINAKDNDFLTCPNDIEDDAEFGKEVGFFAPEWWNYISGTENDDGEDNFGGEIVKHYDEWGNTNYESALLAIMENRRRAELKKPESFRFYCSQRPLSIKEAFAIRKESKFPRKLLEAQRRRIEDKQYPLQHVELEQDENGKIIYKNSSRLPITSFPVDPKLPDKTGVIVMAEKPVDNPVFAETYFASTDPVGEGRTTTSESLCSIYIYKNDTLVRDNIAGEVTTYVEPGKLVAWWCGRFDDINDTHERLLMMMEWYNAWTIVENNIAHFIHYCIAKRKQKYLVPKSQIIFLREIGANEAVFSDYGWKNTGTIFSKNFVDYGIEFLKEKISEEYNTNGETVKVVYGIERILDIMAIKEMEAYYQGVNVDRLVALFALIAFVKTQMATRGMPTREGKTEASSAKKDADLYKITKSAYRHMGASKRGGSQKPNRNPFKNLK